MPFAVMMTGVSPVAYLVADLPFQIIMALSNFLTILWLYPPLKKVYQSNLPLIS
jgi:energy-coupling factor transport system substrate-specific component